MSSPIRQPRRHTSVLILMCAIMLSVMLSACGSATSTAGSATAVATFAAPSGLLQSGQLLVGTDNTYPPMESVDTASNKNVGFDMDLITEIGTRLGLKTVTQKANFDTILDDLGNKRYDIVISSVTISPERLPKADFVPYFKAGESLLVVKGNPKKIKTLIDLCGLNVGVQTGTVEQKDLDKAQTDCKTAGKGAIKPTVLDSQEDVINLLASGRVDATYQDSPVTDYYNTQHPGKFEVGGTVVNTQPYGIAVRKNDPTMLKAITDAFASIKSDGTYDKLFTKWNLSTGQKI